jgi:hypothetical protein
MAWMMFLDIARNPKSCEFDKEMRRGLTLSSGEPHIADLMLFDRPSLAACRDILDGRHDDLPADAFYFSGDMAEIRGNVRRTLKFGPVTWPPRAQ